MHRRCVNIALYWLILDAQWENGKNLGSWTRYIPLSGEKSFYKQQGDNSTPFLFGFLLTHRPVYLMGLIVVGTCGRPNVTHFD